MNLAKAVAISKILPATLFLVCLTPLTGCRLCADGEDVAYPAYGGSWQRTTRDSGRVGSVFDSAGGKVAQLTNKAEPLSADALERQRQGLRTEDMFDPEKPDPEEPDPESITPDDSPQPPSILKDLQDQSLDDIPDTKEEEQLRNKRLDDINIR
ncbi:MAG: hypothetical protein OSA98_17200 [Rubripirellula sp.]|nr:hypothetical protein [Rubripirellula sp.]